MACHDGQPRFRRPILAIVGGTRLGKSMLAAHTLKRVANKLGLKDFLEVTVEDSENMDLADFDRRVHAGVLLDGVGDAMFLKRNREALQGRPKIVKGARSAANVFSIPILSVDGQLSQLSICRSRTWENSIPTIGCAIVRMSNCYS